ncbi:hypothetical protein [Actinoplanes sp. NPDC051859]|uniref:hypothetical protein n=1 Tax=Actinoplanes sp. NPDC051859 TaxID=3363909 RepID=UPI0037B49BDE
MHQHRHARKRNPLPWALVGVFVVALGVVTVPRLVLPALTAGDEAAANGPAPVAAATAEPMLTVIGACDPVKEGLKLSSDNRKLTVNGSGKVYLDGLDQRELACVFDTLRVPGALSSRMSDTVAADGRQQGDWPGYTVVWTHDEDRGLDLTVTRAD